MKRSSDFDFFNWFSRKKPLRLNTFKRQTARKNQKKNDKLKVGMRGKRLFPDLRRPPKPKEITHTFSQIDKLNIENWFLRKMG